MPTVILSDIVIIKWFIIRLKVSLPLMHFYLLRVETVTTDKLDQTLNAC